MPFPFAEAANKAKVEQELIKLNQEMAAAEVRGDIPALERLFTDDYTHSHAVGVLEKRADFLDDIKAGRRKYSALDLSEVEVRAYTASAIITGHVHIKNLTGDTQNLFLDVWVLQQGKWRMAAWVTTRIPPAPAGSVVGK
jgi:hypothetical protein